MKSKVFVIPIVTLFLAVNAFAARPQCSDGKDNDRDGRKDYPKDPGCTSARDNDERNARVAAPVVGGDLKNRRAFPDDNVWNQDISSSPVDPNSETLISSMGANTGLHPDFGTVWDGAPIGIPYVVVGRNQPKVSVSFDYADESDRGPYPIPPNPPIEGGTNGDGDRHILIVDSDSWKLYELFGAFQTAKGWHAGSGAIFDLNSNAVRPAGWTSADAAGLPVFPGLARYDEMMKYGEIRHALRFTASKTRRGYVFPASHFASSNTSASLPPMGMRVRLKASFNISSYPAPVQVILLALKKYGMILADNGSNWFVSGAPDKRWNDDALGTLRDVKGSDFEVVEMGTVVSD